MAKKLTHLSAVVPLELREQFFAACHATDRKASQLIRDYMRSYILANAGAVAAAAQQLEAGADHVAD